MSVYVHTMLGNHVGMVISVKLREQIKTLLLRLTWEKNGG